MKSRIKGRIDKSLENIEELKIKAREVKESEMYADEYKQKKLSELQLQIQSINEKLAEDIKTIFDNRIDTLEAQKIIKGVDDNKVSSILTMLQITKDNLTQDELQQLYNDNIDQTIVTRTIKGIAEQRNIPLETKPGDISRLESLRDTFYSKLKTEGADSLSMALQVELLPNDL